MKIHKTWTFCFVFLFGFLLLGCDTLEKTAYQVLAITQANHEVTHQYCSEAVVHNLIDGKQWDRFNVMSHTFTDAHNKAVDTFELWQRKKTKENEESLKAVLLNLPAVLQEVEGFGKGCKQTMDFRLPNKSDLIRVVNIKVDDKIASPLIIKGEVRGYWYFEGSFPINLLDADGKIIAQTLAHAKSDWMTTDFVPFEAEIIFTKPSTTNAGILVLEKDNQSDLTENADELKIPIHF